MFNLNVMSSTLFSIVTLWSLLTWLTATPQEVPFPTCSDVMQKCAIGCRNVSISALPYNGEYSSNNVLCINYTNSSVAVPPYRLQGCPNVFFNSAQNTSGVCSIPVEPENATDLLLIPNELEPTLYSFYCLYSVSPTHTILSIAIVASDDAAYRDVEIYINHVLQGSKNSTNITVDVGDNVTIVIRAVGNISVISAGHRSERFICRTHFACNSETRNNIRNRYLQCSLQSAELSDDGRTLEVALDYVKWRRFIITLNEQQSPHPSMTFDDSSGGSSSISTSAIVAIAIAVPTVVLFTIVVIIIIIYRQVSKKKSSKIFKEFYRKSGNCREKEVLTSFYSKLISILPIDDIKDKLVSARIITMDDIQDIDRMARDKSKTSFILKHIDASLGADGTNNFYKLLDIMEESHNDDVKAVVRDIRRALVTGLPQVTDICGNQVLILSCCRYDQFYGEISLHGYTMERVQTESDADSNGNTLRTSLDQGIPLITCNCSECELPREVAQLLGSPSMPDNWNILQLCRRQTGNRNPLQCDGRIKVTYTDLHDDIPMGEVLDWLQTKVCRRSSNHELEQGVLNIAYMQN